MAKSATERVREWRRRHPERARELQRKLRARKKARRQAAQEAEVKAKREKMAAIVAELERVRK